MHTTGPFVHEIVTVKLKRQTVVITERYNCYQLHTKFYPRFSSQG